MQYGKNSFHTNNWKLEGLDEENDKKKRLSKTEISVSTWPISASRRSPSASCSNATSKRLNIPLVRQHERMYTIIIQKGIKLVHKVLKKRKKQITNLALTARCHNQSSGAHAQTRSHH